MMTAWALAAGVGGCVDKPTITSSHTYTHTVTPTHTHKHTQSHPHTHTQTHTHTHTHIHTHTHRKKTVQTSSTGIKAATLVCPAPFRHYVPRFCLRFLPDFSLPLLPWCLLKGGSGPGLCKTP